MNIKIYNKTIKSTLINFVFNINGAQITTVKNYIYKTNDKLHNTKYDTLWDDMCFPEGTIYPYDS